jgi:LmbE family N-acetylglucosaminyl deacetylase
MHPISLTPPDAPLRVVCLGAHSDDIEIGCAGTVLTWLARHRAVDVTWVVVCGAGERGREAERSARALLRRARRFEVVLGAGTDGMLPAEFADVKNLLRGVCRRTEPDVVLTHGLEDRHQDHRLVGELTWQLWRDHTILEYEVPKYEGDLGQPNVFMPLTRAVAARKIRHLSRHFASQRSKTWYRPETFAGLMHVRAVECRARSGVAEAFRARKLVV